MVFSYIDGLVQDSSISSHCSIFIANALPVH